MAGIRQCGAGIGPASHTDQADPNRLLPAHGFCAREGMSWSSWSWRAGRGPGSGRPAEPDRPKQFLPLLNGRSPMGETLARAVLLAPPECVWVSGNTAHRDLVEASLSPGMRAVYEPSGRGTAPCLGLAALHLAREDPEAVMVAMPADNWVGPGAAFCVEAGAAADLALRGGLVVVGTKPAGPAGGFGYLKPGCPVETDSPEIRASALEEFIEKPDSGTGRRSMRRRMALECRPLCLQGGRTPAGDRRTAAGSLAGPGSSPRHSRDAGLRNVPGRGLGEAGADSRSRRGFWPDCGDAPP